MIKTIHINQVKNDRGESGYKVLAFEGQDCILDEFFYMSEMAQAFSEHWLIQDHKEWANLVSLRRH